ncbi:LIM domain-containing protein HDR3-like [Rhododendron vialii]|uniref:LIM domain-containing protein HDR3-like n=1 Tax=Rhododendron vialii TaxID=182163 RepID=UPI00265F84B0|nr:LIM domain-containing protein HDR3-like [Rhododendron vialii]
MVVGQLGSGFLSLELPRCQALNAPTNPKPLDLIATPILTTKSRCPSHNPYDQGLTLFDDKATIKIVERCVRRGTDMEVVTKKKEVKRDKVVAILLLFGFPKLILGATLAHEMGHALIKLQGWTFILERKVEEGICEAIAYEWLKYTVPNCDPSYTQKEVAIAEWLQIKDMSAIKKGRYAAEFGEAHRAIRKYGLKRTLKHVAHWRDIPE